MQGTWLTGINFLKRILALEKRALSILMDLLGIAKKTGNICNAPNFGGG
jgi:nicotinate-nucleotide pyrophosphorylase